MTVELYRFDPYRSDFDARVTQRSDEWIGLDQTCFWPGDGSISSQDTGVIGSHHVDEIRRLPSRQLLHRVRTDFPDRLPNPGDHVVGAIDWKRRYKTMRTHSARYLVDLALRSTHDLVGLTPTVASDGVFELSVVLASGGFDPSAVCGWVEAVVSDDLPIHVVEDPTSSGLRSWHLDGVGHRPCGGLHVCSTGEVGTVHIHKVGWRGIRLQLRLEVEDIAGLSGQPP